MLTFPEKWGYKGKLDECIGKTIAKAELVRMEFGCTWDTAWVVEFIDGSKAFFVGGQGSGIMNPSIEKSFGCKGVEDSEIFTPEEYGEMVANRKRSLEIARQELKEKECREYNRLKEKFEK